MAGLRTEEKKMEFMVLFVQNRDDTFERQIVWRLNLSCWGPPAEKTTKQTAEQLKSPSG